MRYESFYPFARQQPAPPYMGQFGFGPPPQMGQEMGPGFGPSQPFPNGPMNQNIPNGPGNQAFSDGQMQHAFGGSMPAQGMAQGMQETPSKMDTYMQTANRFLNTAQQFAPVVQQFAPMVQNLPAMWRLYKGFQSLPAADAAASTAATAASGAAATSGTSIPRIFQPPS
ncbi:hypothetical protein MHZ95_14095 [Sporosarcina sp. ACRSM]|uniref:VrrA/YqfQ family protein n=1 Tax=Sporosarcina sp. ACRSM TaxID=2918216 RepID=UPI001EF618F4|nr:VrrA/YqfQ family protein [Sporosarcina sp. ACRSM]MCG7336396.1 hypothetical protein [Sporosarcina sp. ACRSM]